MGEGIICDIERCSMSDGPGIRTVVFFKGCNLRCAWCHNPESISPAPQLLFYQEKCTHCGRCAEACPIGAVGTVRCTACGCCTDVCPARARRISGERMVASDVMHHVLADRPFYEASGGGVTFSGGECMLQMDFLCELLAACRAEGISTAIDTAGNVPFDGFDRVLPMTNHLLYDIKCMTPTLHKALTGADNARILDNYCRLWHIAPQKLIVRVPIVPGYNAVDDELAHIANFLRTYPPAEYELLPYHALGEAKRAALKLCACASRMPDAQTMDSCHQLFGALHGPA